MSTKPDTYRIISIVLTVLAILLCGCDNIDTSNTSSEEVKKRLDQVLGGAKGLMDEFELRKPKDFSLEKMATDEVDKLFTVEYRVVEIDDFGEGAHIEALLNKFGKDRWDCFALDHVQKKIRFYCKRKPQSYLRYLTRSF